MLKHNLFQQSDTTSLLDSSVLKEISPIKDTRPAVLDPVTLMLGRKIKRNTKHPGVVSSNPSSESDSLRPVPIMTHDSASDADTNTDTDTDNELNDIFPKTKLPYTAEEDEWIINFVLRGQNIFKVSSILLWKHLEAKKENPKRTYQSLKNRFLRNIKPHLFTRYKHLVKDGEKVEQILEKFPELKHTVGRISTLSRIHLPPRKKIPRCEKFRRQNGIQKDNQRSDPPLSPVPIRSEPSASGRTPVPPSSERNHSGRIELTDLNLFNVSSLSRKVITTEDKVLTITVNFKSKTPLQSSTVSFLGIYEKYKKLKESNKLVLCAACGNYNLPKSSAPVNFAREESLNERDVLIPNSLDVPGSSAVGHDGQGTGSPSAKVTNRSYKRRRIVESNNPALESPDRSRSSQGLLDHEFQQRGQEETSRRPDAGSEAPPEASRREDNAEDMDEDLNTAYENTVMDFRELISSEEERLLVKKCFVENREVLGIDSNLEMNTDSYFGELSPNLETPMLTEDYSTQPQSSQSVAENETSGNSLARNMMKMLGMEIKCESHDENSICP